MTIDIQAMLARVVADVFGEDTAVRLHTDHRDSWQHCARLTRLTNPELSATIRASYEWFDVLLHGHNVQAILFDYDDVEAEKEVEVRRLALMVAAYLRGEGRVEYRRTLFRRRLVPVVHVVVDGLEWELGRHMSSVPYPAGE